MTESSSKQEKLGWLVVIVGSLFFFYEFIQLNLFNAINEDLMQAFNLDAIGLGSLASTYFYGNLLFLLPAGMLLDRFSTKNLLLAAIIITTIGTFAFAAATSFQVAALGRFVVGVGASFCFLSCIRLASRWFPPSKMAFVTGIVVTMAMLGGLVAQTPLAKLASMVGWRNAVYTDVALGLVVTFLIMMFVQDRPPNSKKEEEAAKIHLKTMGFWSSVKLVLINKNNWLGGLYTSLMNFPIFILGALWGMPYLMQVHHFSILQASYATTMLFVGVIFGSPAFGYFSDHLGKRILPMILGAIVSLFVILYLMYVPNLSLPTVLFLFFLIGFVTSSQVLSYPTIAELNPISLTSTAVSVCSMTIMLSGVLCQPFFGWMLERNWDQTIVDGVRIYSREDFNYALLLLPISFALSIFIAWMVKETNCKSTVVPAPQKRDESCRAHLSY